MSGAYCSLQELVSLRFQAQNLPLFRPETSHHQMSGCARSPFKGRGVDFEEVRAYQFGDDIRSIDWRVTARRMTPHTKVFREERERPVMVLLDQSHGMFFGSQLNFKSVTAAETAAMLAWATLNHGDRIGGVIFNEHELTEIRPRRSKKALMHLFSQTETMNRKLSASAPAGVVGNHLAKALRHIRRVAHPGTQLFIISDFTHLDEEAERHLARLARHCELLAIQISDPLEQELPRPDRYLITNGVHRQAIDTRQASIRLQFRRQHLEHSEQLARQLGRYQVPLLPMTTSEATDQQLLTLYGVKSSGVKSSGVKSSGVKTR